MSNAQIAIAQEATGVQAMLDLKPPEAFGATFNPRLDGGRLGEQVSAVWHAMRIGNWVTLPELRAVAPGMDTAISARIRQIRTWLRENDRGDVESERMQNGLWRYRIVRSFPKFGVHLKEVR